MFEDATLTKCDIYSTLKRGAIQVRPLLVHTCTYALIVVLKSTAHVATYEVKCKKNSIIHIRSELVSPLKIHIGLDPCSQVASP